MKCNCSISNGILAVIILILALWPFLGAMASKWVIVVAAALLIIHAFMHKHIWMDSKKK